MTYLKILLSSLLLCLLISGCAEITARTSGDASSPPLAKKVEVSETEAGLPTAIAEATTVLRRISSNVLGYDLQYWVQLPADYQIGTAYPTLYITDGWWYKEDGGLPGVAKDLMAEDQIQDIILIYVDAYDPDNQKNNRRNSQFLCKPKYVQFYKEELVPAVDDEFRTDASRTSRGMLGVSFGGLNSMYFGIHAHDTFGKIGIQSPAPHPCPDIYTEYENRDRLPIEIYLSTGTVNDKAKATRRLKRILDEKGYEFAYDEVPHGHTWANWTPLLDDVLLHFYGSVAN
ncbi:MAG: alpha/beta hydrolase-fold protein [Bacteroidota bacterium]